MKFFYLFLTYIMVRKKTYRKGKKTYRKRKRIVKPKSGFLKAMRWSSKDSANTCHVLIQGSDALPGSYNTTTFSLFDLASYGEFLNLFDNYRITRVVYRWVVTRSPDWNSTTANRGWSIRVGWCHDFNDSIGINQLNIWQRSNLKEAYLNTDKLKTKWYSLRPSCLMQLYEGTGATAYAPKWRQWVDTADYSMPHYGIKYAYDNLYTGCNLRLEAKIYCEFKGVS